MKVSIILFPGTNRENDMADAFRHICGSEPKFVWHKETELGNPDLIVLPGGFSYGDYLRCGAMAANSPIMSEVIKKAENGTKIFGVCNGFQMLVETGLLPGGLLRNKNLKFICKQVHLRCENNNSDFTNLHNDSEIIKVPIAHGEGNYFADEDTVKELEDNNLVAFRYCNENGEVSENCNPNGSINNIAGIMNKRKTILGMMPHPENATAAHHDNTSGSKIFESILKAFG